MSNNAMIEVLRRTLGIANKKGMQITVYDDGAWLLQDVEDPLSSIARGNGTNEFIDALIEWMDKCHQENIRSIGASLHTMTTVMQGATDSEGASNE